MDGRGGEWALRLGMIVAIANQLAGQRAKVIERARGLPEHRLADQPAHLVNHAAWTLAHLHFMDRLLLSILGKGTVEVPLMRHFGPGSVPQGNLDAWRAQFGSLNGCIEKLSAGHAAAMDAVRSLTADDLARPTKDEPARAMFPTLGDVLAYMLWHEGYHAGQLSQWCRAAGLGR